jgi:hypothetical protein
LVIGLVYGVYLGLVGGVSVVVASERAYALVENYGVYVDVGFGWGSGIYQGEAITVGWWGNGVPDGSG